MMSVMAAAARFDVYAYFDYRTLLRSYYEDKKEHGRGFSYRAFARRAGLKSPNHLKRVIDGSRNLTPEMAERFAKACGFEGEEVAYFRELVAFNEAKTEAERSKRYRTLSAFRGYRKAHKLEAAEQDYCASWYIPAIRELSARPDFREDPAWIAKQLVPAIKASQARTALDTLLALGLLRRDGDKLRAGEQIVTTGAETRGMHIVSYHRAMMERASEAMVVIPKAQRDISSLTLALGRGGLELLKHRIQEFRRELLGLEQLGEDVDQIVQLNLQLFPLSRSRTGDEP
jgi:uncharacterized protein (TIGR02147 family)